MARASRPCSPDRAGSLPRRLWPPSRHATAAPAASSAAPSLPIAPCSARCSGAGCCSVWLTPAGSRPVAVAALNPRHCPCLRRAGAAVGDQVWCAEQRKKRNPIQPGTAGSAVPAPRAAKRARSASVGAPVRPATVPPAVRAPSQSVRQQGPRPAPICPSNWSESS